jgi:hypothetical protein
MPDAGRYLRSTFALSETQFRGTGTFSALPKMPSAYRRPPGRPLARGSGDGGDDEILGGWAWDNHPSLPALVRVTCKKEAVLDPVARSYTRAEFIQVQICAPPGKIVDESSRFQPAVPPTTAPAHPFAAWILTPPPITTTTPPWLLESPEMDTVAGLTWTSDLPIQAYHDYCALFGAPHLHSRHVRHCLKALPPSLGNTPEAAAFVKKMLEPWSLASAASKPRGASPAAGALCWGPPGTGKTTFAQGVLSAAGVRILWAGAAPELSSKWIGETEKRLKQLFEASLQTPHLLCAILIDEIDTLVGQRGASSASRSETKVDWASVMLSLTDGRFPNLLVVGTTNRKTVMDPAFLRPPRMSEHFFFGRMLSEDRLALFRSLVPCRAKPGTWDADWHDRQLVACSHLAMGFTGAVMDLIAKVTYSSPHDLLRAVFSAKHATGHIDLDIGSWMPQDIHTQLAARAALMDDHEESDPTRLFSHQARSSCGSHHGFVYSGSGDVTVYADTGAFSFRWRVPDRDPVRGPETPFEGKDEMWELYLCHIGRVAKAEYCLRLDPSHFSETGDHAASARHVLAEVDSNLRLFSSRVTPSSSLSWTEEEEHENPSKLLVTCHVDPLLHLFSTESFNESRDEAVDPERKTTKHTGGSRSIHTTWSSTSLCSTLVSLIGQLARNPSVIVGLRIECPRMRSAFVKSLRWGSPSWTCADRVVPTVDLSRDRVTLFHPPSIGGRRTTLLDLPDATGTKMTCVGWGFRVLASSSAMAIEVGLVAAGADPSKSIRDCHVSFCIHLGTGQLYGTTPAYGKMTLLRTLTLETPPKVGHTVRFLYHRVWGLLILYVNDRCQGILFIGLSGELVPAIGTGPGDHVELLSDGGEFAPIWRFWDRYPMGLFLSNLSPGWTTTDGFLMRIEGTARSCWTHRPIKLGAIHRRRTWSIRFVSLGADGPATGHGPYRLGASTASPFVHTDATLAISDWKKPSSTLVTWMESRGPREACRFPLTKTAPSDVITILSTSDTFTVTHEYVASPDPKGSSGDESKGESKAATLLTTVTQRDASGKTTACHSYSDSFHPKIWPLVSALPGSVLLFSAS